MSCFFAVESKSILELISQPKLSTGDAEYYTLMLRVIFFYFLSGPIFSFVAQEKSITIPIQDFEAITSIAAKKEEGI
ncbi:hypothetical protein IGI37_000226 [Enterococcus sp. AZ194]|uniref:hypothetical protein n=1 Tax=Enterococcus sp. AZ194 TaxID=2774629 RepID=UPI003F27012C